MKSGNKFVALFRITVPNRDKLREEVGTEGLWRLSGLFLAASIAEHQFTMGSESEPVVWALREDGLFTQSYTTSQVTGLPEYGVDIDPSDSSNDQSLRMLPVLSHCYSNESLRYEFQRLRQNNEIIGHALFPVEFKGRVLRLCLDLNHTWRAEW